MIDSDTPWPRRRRGRRAETAPARFEEALALCLKALRRGDLRRAHAEDNSGLPRPARPRRPALPHERKR